MKKFVAIVLSLLIIAGLSFTAFANDGAAPEDTKVPSPTTPKTWVVEVYYHLATVELVARDTVEDGATYHFQAENREGYTFEYYTVDGEFELLKKGVTRFDTMDPIDFSVKSNIRIDVYFKEAGNQGDDDNPDSPATGVNTWVLTLAVLLGIGGAFLATKKLLKDN